MDLQSALVCVLVFVVSAVILLLISMFGMREKSYEEALAEQRQLTSGLLGTNQKLKAKDKKLKKAGKKVKEKQTAENENAEEEEQAESSTQDVIQPTPVHIAPTIPTKNPSPSKLRVEFEEPAVIEPSHNSNNKKRVKKEKVKPILLNKEKSPISEVDISKNPPANHFEQIHPKDEFELLQSHKEESVKQEKVEEKVKVAKIKVEKEVEKKEIKVKEKKQAVVVEETAPAVQEVPKVAAPPQNIVKDKKKKKSEFNTLQQMTAGDTKLGVGGVGVLVPLVRKADLSRSEIQILIDLLLNKQHEAPALHQEWTQGKTDQMQKLKKQLAEKERALAEEQETCAGAQAKLREVRAELNSERSRLLQNQRNIEESLHAKLTELQAAHARLHSQNNKLQQLQSQLNDEVMSAHKLREELNAMQMQRQQLDLHLNQKQETENSFQSQLAQLRSELQEQQNINQQLTMELHTIRDKSHAEKESLRERIRQIESQAVHFKNESDQKIDLVRQLEESRRMYSELEHRFGVTHRNETELKIRCQQHLEDARRLETSQTKSHDELTKLQSEVQRINLIHKQQQDDNKRALTELQSQLTSVQAEKNQLEASNGSANEDQSKQVEILNLQNELASARAQLKQREIELLTEVKTAQDLLKQLETEVQMQRNKNDELRKKNWKVMEALNVAENSLRSKQNSSSTVNDIDENIKKAKLEEQEKSKQFLQRLFPEIKIPNNDQYFSSAEKEIKNYIISLKNSQTQDDTKLSELQTQLVHYRTIIDDTEGMLNKLQSYVEKEETNWRKDIKSKEEEIELLKEKAKTERLSLEQKVSELEKVAAEKPAVKIVEKIVEKTVENPIHKHTNTTELTPEELVEISKLQSQLAHYRTIIDDTEGMLNRLQTHVEKEEINWRNEIEAKNKEIEQLKEQARTQMKIQINDLEEKVKTEQKIRQELENECESLRSRLLPTTHSKHTQSVNLAGVEQIVEEKERLAQELVKEQQRCRELSEEVLRLRSSHSDSSIQVKTTQNHTANGTSLENVERFPLWVPSWRLQQNLFYRSLLRR